MSKTASEMDPENANVNQLDSLVGEEEQIPSNDLQEESPEESGIMGKETQTKMMSVLEQVRNQIRSQGGVKAPKSGILELISKIKDTETRKEQENNLRDGNNADAEEEEDAEVVKDVCKEDTDLKLEMLSKIFDEKLEACKKVLREEFEVQISAVRKEMQAHTNQTLKDLECQITGRKPGSLQQTHGKALQEGADAVMKRRASAAPSLAARRGKFLTLTPTTTVIPSAPVISGPHAKLNSSSRGQSSLARGHVLSPLEKKSYRSPLPPARPPLHQGRKSVQPKGKTGSQLCLGDN